MPKKQPNRISISISEDFIKSKILLFRGKKVLLDKELANLYEIKTSNLNKAVKRNIDRFPDDFMFQLNEKELSSLRFQSGTSNKGRGGRRYLPYVFTQEGVAMLSTVLNSPRAIQANIQIMRTFVKIREMMDSHKILKKKIEELELKYDHQFNIVFKAIKKLLEEPSKPKKKIGFHSGINKEVLSC